MNRAQRRLGVAAVSTLAADAASKIYAVQTLERPIEIGGSLSLQVSYNPGVAFGMGQSLPTALVVTVMGLICIAMAGAGAVGLILGGALGNLFDRLIGGSVVDMIHLTWWPSFNLADAAICVGALGVVVSSLRRESTAVSGAAGRSQ